MITKEQAMRSQEFHADGCVRRVGPRGGVKEKIDVWRRNGATRLWEREPERFEIPVKFGLRNYDTIYERCRVHLPEDCPLGGR